MLKNIHVQNFRNLSDLTVEQLARVNLFTGRNNSGKTTLLEALFLLIGEGDPAAAVAVNNGRGIDTAGGMLAVREAFWKPMFFAFDMSRNIVIKALHKMHGQLSLRIKLEWPATMEVPLKELGARPGVEFLSGSALSFAFSIAGCDPAVRNMRVTGDQIQVERPEARLPFHVVFLSSRNGNHQTDAMRLGQLRQRKQVGMVLEALKVVEPRLQSVEDNSASGTPMIWGDIGLSELVPLPVMGEGMTRVARLMLAISAAPGGGVLIDEIENGLHHEILPKVWQAVDTAAKIFDTQVFATTHSYECLEAAHQALGADDFRLHRLEAEEGLSRCVTLEPDQIGAVIRHSMEVR